MTEESVGVHLEASMYSKRQTYRMTGPGLRTQKTPRRSDVAHVFDVISNCTRSRLFCCVTEARAQTTLPWRTSRTRSLTILICCRSSDGTRQIRGCVFRPGG